MAVLGWALIVFGIGGWLNLLTARLVTHFTVVFLATKGDKPTDGLKNLIIGQTIGHWLMAAVILIGVLLVV